MALRAMYKGIKKVLAPLIIKWPGELAIDQDALNTELNTVFFPRSEQAVLGAKNLLKYPYNGTISGNIVFSPQNDGSINVSGASGAIQAQYYLCNRFVYDFQLPAGTYKATGGVSSSLSIQWSKNKVTGDNTQGSDYLGGDLGDGVIFTLSQLSDIQGIVTVSANTTLSETINIKPMVRLASDQDDTYAPYAMTNKALTEKVATLIGSASDQKTAINAIITAATGAEDFAAFKTAMGAITPVTRSLSMTAAPEEIAKEVSIEEPIVEKKTTTRKKATAKADTTEEV